MSALPTPPPEVVSPDVPNRDQLLERIDTHLERYLQLLDQYQTLRKELSSSFSSGFISLAQANFSAPSRVRYGEDHYDDRTKAWKRVQLSSDDSGILHFSVTHQDLTPKKTNEAKKSGDAVDADPNVHLSDAGANPTKQKPGTDEPSLPEEEEVEITTDPIRWFGLFVPSALKSSQKHFADSIDGPIPKLCAVIREMRTVESAIGRTRKQVKKLA